MKALAVAMLCILLAGCAASATPSAIATASPVASSTLGSPPVGPGPTSSPATASLAFCAPTMVDVPGAAWTGGGGAMLGSFVVRNTGSTPCLGTDPESVGLQDASGKSLAVNEVKEVSKVPSHPVLLPGLPIPSGDGALAAGYGSVAFIWSEWCGPDPARPVSLVVHLGPGVTRVVPVVQSGSIPRCDTPGSSSTLDVYPLDILPGDPSLVSPAPSR